MDIELSELGAKVDAERERIVGALRDLVQRIEHLPDDLAQDALPAIVPQIDSLISRMVRWLPARR